MNGFTVCFLFYGDHPALARRCLGSVARTLDPAFVTQLRVGLNAVCRETRDYVLSTLSDLPVPSLVYESSTNVWKYPLMRRMFHRPSIVTPFTMWWDDDSYLDTTDESWWRAVYESAQMNDMIGEVWKMRFHGRVADGIKAQPWYTGKPFLRDANGDYMRFATGGWWCIKTRLLQKWDWPPLECRHNGGDYPLGELLRQQGLKLGQFNADLQINAGKRRGETTKLMWYDYHPDSDPDTSHHDFDVGIYDPRDGRPADVRTARVDDETPPSELRLIDLGGF